MWKKIRPYVFSVLLALAVGGLSAWITGDNMSIYDRINKPAPAPPGIVFPIVWGILYLLMGISAACIYVHREREPALVRQGLTVYAISLAVNFLWSPIFFRAEAFLTAFVWLGLLWVLVLRTVILYRRVCPTAAYLQVPYLIWVTFAGYLNFSIWFLNR